MTGFYRYVSNSDIWDCSGGINITAFWDVTPYSRVDVSKTWAESSSSIFMTETPQLETTGTSETIVSIYQTTRLHIPEVRP